MGFVRAGHICVFSGQAIHSLSCFSRTARAEEDADVSALEEDCSNMNRMTHHQHTSDQQSITRKVCPNQQQASQASHNTKTGHGLPELREYISSV